MNASIKTTVSRYECTVRDKSGYKGDAILKSDNGRYVTNADYELLLSKLKQANKVIASELDIMKTVNY